MKMMKRTILILPAIVALAAAPATAGGVSLYPSWWQTEDADEVGGAGVKFDVPFNEWLAFEAGATYYEELTSDPVEFVGDSPGVFEDDSISAIPVELGLRFNLSGDNARAWHPYLAGGGSYFALDSDQGNLDDEFGYYAAVGSNFGDSRGADFFAEVQHRWVDGTITDLELDDDEDTQQSVAIDLQGFAINMGVTFNW